MSNVLAMSGSLALMFYTHPSTGMSIQDFSLLSKDARSAVRRDLWKKIALLAASSILVFSQTCIKSFLAEYQILDLTGVPWDMYTVFVAGVYRIYPFRCSLKGVLDVSFFILFPFLTLKKYFTKEMTLVFASISYSINIIYLVFSIALARLYSKTERQLELEEQGRAYRRRLAATSLVAPVA